MIALLVLVVTIYVPGAGGINGGLYGADWRHGTPLSGGECACGPRYRFGTVFVVLDENLENYAPSRVLTCRDRGSAIGNRNLDVVAFSLRDAFAWGRRQRQVMVFGSVSTYYQTCSLSKRLGEPTDFCRR